MPHNLLVIEDDDASRRLLQATFAAEGFEVAAAPDGISGLERVNVAAPDAIILDLQMPNLDGMAVLDRVRITHPTLPVIVLTAESGVRSAVRATQLGAFDYLTKPVDPEEIVHVVNRALETRALKAEVADLRRQLNEGGGLAAQMGPSDQVREVIEQVRTVAASNFSVLVLGETGTGKELVAQAIHRQSDRRTQSFVAIDCGAIPENLLESELFGHEKGAFTGAERRKKGQFQLAEGGTLFLDEIGNLPLGLQSKLLRALESRRILALGATDSLPMDVRFVAATNNDLQAKVQDGHFRADLYFRLAQFTISLPALRDRPIDIAHLAQRFLEEVSLELKRPVQGIAAEALVLLESHCWTGNVRELRNVIRQAVLQTKDIVLQAPLLERVLGRKAATTAPATPSAPAGSRSLKSAAEEASREAEHRVICDALRTTRGNKSHAARILQTDFKTLHLKIKSLGIRVHDFSPE